MSAMRTCPFCGSSKLEVLGTADPREGVNPMTDSERTEAEGT